VCTRRLSEMVIRRTLKIYRCEIYAANARDLLITSRGPAIAGLSGRGKEREREGISETLRDKRGDTFAQKRWTTYCVLVSRICYLDRGN